MTISDQGLALTFVRDSKAVSGYIDSVDVMFQAALEHVRKLNARNADAAANAFREELHRAMSKEIPELESLLAQVYATHFTNTELEEMHRFFRTPTGQKMIRSTSRIAMDFAMRTADFQKRMSTIIMPGVRDALLDRGFAA